MKYNLKKQRGAAAIFIVVFFAILISVIALSFLRISLQDQQQATDNDLSQSAYDSSEAGLEDAERALSWYNAHCPRGGSPVATDQNNCDVYNAEFANPERCNIANLIHNTNTLPGTATVGATSEVKVAKPSSNEEALEQAYTCVTIKTRTNDYVATAENGKSDTLIPLRTVNNDIFDTVELNWFTAADAGTNAPQIPTTKDLPSNWPATAPPVMRFQLIPVLRVAGGIKIDDIDKDTKTVFISPSTSASGQVALNVADTGRSALKTTAPNSARCQSPISGTFSCSVQINQLIPATGGTFANTDYYLRLTAFYKNTSYQLRLLNGTDVRQFDNVEPEIDSTGRANDVFRRIQSRVNSTTSDNPLKDGGFDISKGICKDFKVPAYETGCNPLELVNP